VKAKNTTSAIKSKASMTFNAQEYFMSLPLHQQVKIGFEFGDSSLMKELTDSIDSINKLNSGDFLNSGFADYKYSPKSVDRLNTLFNDSDFVLKFMEMMKLLHLGKTAFQVLNTEVNLFIKKGTSIDSEYVVARTNIQSFEYVNGVRKAITKRYSAHVGSLSKYPKKLKDPQIKIDALPKLYRRILKSEVFNS